MRRHFLSIAGFCALFLEGNCLHRSRPPLGSPPSASDSFNSDKGYQDLAPGSHLRIMLPLLKHGDTNISLDTSQSNGREITLSAKNLIGFQLLHYTADGDQSGKVQLNFISAEITKNGHTSNQKSAPHLPFPLPQTAQFVRLVFLLRVSETDHNMAIIAAGSRNGLELFTIRINQNTAACQTTSDLFCTWIPQGVAVRPE